MVQKFRKDTLKKLIPEPGETQIHQTIWPPYKGAGLPATLSIHHQVEPTHEIHLCISQNCSMTKSGNSAIAHVLFYLSASKYLTEFNLLEYTRVLDEKLTNEDQGHDSDYIRRFNYEVVPENGARVLLMKRAG